MLGCKRWDRALHVRRESKPQIGHKQICFASLHNDRNT
jgi:hypothetical protein